MITTYQQALDHLAGGRDKARRKVANNTYAELRDNGDIAIRLHATDVVTYHANGEITLDTGGWLTVTTKDRIDSFTPRGIRVHSVKGRWMLSLLSDFGSWDTAVSVPYVDGVRLAHMDERWTPVTDVPDAKEVAAADNANAKINRKINKYAALYTDEKVAELVEHAIAEGVGGDCWFCSMKTKEGVPLGDAGSNANTEHLLSHMEENYAHLSLALNAMVANGNYTAEQAQRFVQYPHMSHRVRESVRNYLRNRLYTPGVATKNGRRPAVPADQLHRTGY